MIILSYDYCFDYMKKILLGSALVSVVVNTADARTVARMPEKCPNLVFVVVDDFGWGGFAPNNGGYDYTMLNQDFIRKHVKDYSAEEAFLAAEQAVPTLSGLCTRGTRFSNAYASSNLSTPSRAGMLTSCYQERFGYYILQEQKAGIPSDVPMMPEILHENGYATACIGKWHVGPESKRGKGDCLEGYHPLDRGFDYYWGFNSSTSKYYGSTVLHKGRENIQAEGYLTDELTRETVDFIRRTDDDKPFMVYLAYNALHGPLQFDAPDKYLSHFHFKSKILNNYYAYLYAVDQGVNEIVKVLEETGRADNTMIVFVSDNGAPGTRMEVLPKNGPLNGFKGQTWQGGVRIPMFIYAPWLPGGNVSDELVSTLDIFPTFMDCAGVKIPKHIDGRSLVSHIEGHPRKIRDYMVWAGQNAECWGIDNLPDQMTAKASFMVCDKEWSLRYDQEAKKFSLYNIADDIGEKNDLSDVYPKKVKQMAGVFRKWYSQMAPPLVWNEKYWKGIEFWNE